MHRLLRLARCLAFSTLLTPLTAQQEFGFEGGNQVFASRGSLGSAAGETLMGVHAAHHRGVGEALGRCAIDVGFRVTIQDQNSATQETYAIVVRDGSDTAGPGPSFTGIGPFRTPPGRGGPAAWRVTHTTARPIPLPGCAVFFAFGLQLPAARTWTGDGLASHVTILDNCAHARAGNLAWQLSAAGVPSRPPRILTWSYAILSRSAAFLQLGNGGRAYGIGGLFPKTGCRLTARTRYPAALGGGSSRLYVSLARTAGVPLVPGSTRLYLGGISAFLGAAPISAAGQAELTIVPALPGVPAGTLVHFQALGIRSTTASLTNSQTARL